ncbi:Platelet-activating factor acetylhydrolase [Trichoplax sp. H2]|nr:Platelet-activating factor acetylhydrolase [Trichoplax sp. H2]|eukprot:RDD36257.1 Platelet-activating factor acetylhydrolase [Trichoplax sp. H2]
MVVDFLNKLQNGEPVKNLSKTNFDLGQFENRLIMSSVGIFGHSFGGATTATVLVKDHRFSCGIALDPWMFPVDHDLHHNFNKPFYVLNAHSFSWPHNITQIQRFMDKDNTENADRKLFTIRETCHIDLTDFPLLLPYFLANQTIKVGNLDPSLKGAVSNKICFDFFEKYLCCTECNRYRGGNINVLDYAFEGTNVEVAGHENDGKELDVLKLIFW